MTPSDNSIAPIPGLEHDHPAGSRPGMMAPHEVRADLDGRLEELGFSALMATVRDVKRIAVNWRYDPVFVECYPRLKGIYSMLLGEKSSYAASTRIEIANLIGVHVEALIGDTQRLDFVISKDADLFAPSGNVRASIRWSLAGQCRVYEGNDTRDAIDAAIEAERGSRG